MPRAKFETDQQYALRNSALTARGQTSGTTDNSGSLVINYYLASEPTTVLANSVFRGQSVAQAQYSITVVNMSSTGSTLRFYGTGSGLVAASTPVTASWYVQV